MKAVLAKISSNPRYARVYEWGKLITITGSAQVVVQVIGLISGIFIIRALSANEYALYTLANTMLSTMVVLSDGGISAGVISQGGKVWQEREKLGSVLATGLNLRKKFAFGSLLIATPVLFFLLRRHGANLLMSLIIILSLIPAFFMALSGNLLEIVPKLRQDIAPFQKIQVKASIGRLSTLCLTLFMFPRAFVAVLATGLPQIWANLHLRKISFKYANWKQEPNISRSKEMITVVKRILPGSIYFCFSTQITIWLISIFGSTSSVAKIGALGRLGMVLGFFNVMFTILVLPRFARLPNNRTLLLTRYSQILVALLILSGGICGTAWIFSSELLLVLGKYYAGLKQELLLSIAGGCLSLIAGLSFSLCTVKGWVINPVLSIVVSLISIACSAALIDISSLNGILLFNVYVTLIQVVMHCLYTCIKISNAK